MSEEGHRESVEATRSFIFPQPVPNYPCQMGRDGMLSCSLLPRHWPPPPWYESPIPWSLCSSESLLPPIGTLHKSSCSLHSLPPQSHPTILLQLEPLPLGWSRHVLSLPIHTGSSGQLSSGNQNGTDTFQTTSSLLQVAFEWMKTSSEGAGGSEGLSLSGQMEAVSPDADDYKIVAILFSQPRNGKQSCSLRCQRTSSASICCYKSCPVAASKHQMSAWNSKPKCVCWRRVKKKKITRCINADAEGFSIQPTG